MAAPPGGLELFPGERAAFVPPGSTKVSGIPSTRPNNRCEVGKRWVRVRMRNPRANGALQWKRHTEDKIEEKHLEYLNSKENLKPDYSWRREPAAPPANQPTFQPAPNPAQINLAEPLPGYYASPLNYGQRQQFNQPAQAAAPTPAPAAREPAPAPAPPHHFNPFHRRPAAAPAAPQPNRDNDPPPQAPPRVHQRPRTEPEVQIPTREHSRSNSQQQTSRPTHHSREREDRGQSSRAPPPRQHESTSQRVHRWVYGAGAAAETTFVPPRTTERPPPPAPTESVAPTESTTFMNDHQTTELLEKFNDGLSVIYMHHGYFSSAVEDYMASVALQWCDRQTERGRDVGPEELQAHVEATGGRWNGRANERIAGAMERLANGQRGRIREGKEYVESQMERLRGRRRRE